MKVADWACWNLAKMSQISDFQKERKKISKLFWGHLLPVVHCYIPLLCSVHQKLRVINLGKCKRQLFMAELLLFVCQLEGEGHLNRWMDMTAIIAITIYLRQKDRIVYLGWPIAPSYMSPNAGWGWRSQPMSTSAHRSPNKLWRSNSIFNLWQAPVEILADALCSLVFAHCNAHSSLITGEHCMTSLTSNLQCMA